MKIPQLFLDFPELLNSPTFPGFLGLWQQYTSSQNLFIKNKYQIKIKIRHKLLYLEM